MGGASRRNLGMLCSPDPFDTSDESSFPFTVARQYVPGGHFTYEIKYHPHQETADSVEWPDEALRDRLLCHVVVNVLPEQGLTEAKETLLEMFGFYFQKPELTVSANPVREVSAKMGQRFERPPFFVAED